MTESTTTITLPDVKRISAEEAISTAVALVQSAKTPDEWEKADETVAALIAKFVSATGDNGAIEKVVIELPSYEKGHTGSARYTKQRGFLAQVLAEALGGQSELVYRSYSYPNPKSGRRHYRVNAFATKRDLSALRELFDAYAARFMTAAYDDSVVPSVVGGQELKPKELSSARRVWFEGNVDTLKARLHGVLDAQVKGAAAARLSDKATRAEQALAAHHASVGDTEQTPDTTA